jgi:glycosyltransferase involved in cell wall biosynthesis
MTPVPENRPLRIVLAAAGLGSGGAERQLCYTAQGLCRNQQVGEVTVACRDLSSPGTDFHRPLLDSLDRCTVVECPAAASDHGRTLPFSLTEMVAVLPTPEVATLHAFLRLFRKIEPDAVQCWQDQINVSAGLAALAAGVPRIVLNCRNSSPPAFSYDQPHFWSAYRYLLRHPQVSIVANSRAGAADYAAWLGLPADRFRVVGNAFLPEAYTPPTPEDSAALRRSLGIPENARTVGAIFRLGDEKNPFLWLEVAKKLADDDPGLHFAVFGDGVLRPSFAAAATATLGHRFHLPGITPSPMTALSIMDLFLLTSRREGLPNVLLESQWMGVPVVAADVGGVRDALVPGGGEAVPGEAERLADACRRALATPPAEVSALRAHIRERFSLDALTDGTLRALTDPAPTAKETPPPEPLARTEAPSYAPLGGNVLALFGFASLGRRGTQGLSLLTEIAAKTGGRVHVLLGPEGEKDPSATERLARLGNVSLVRSDLSPLSAFERALLAAALPPSRLSALAELPDAETAMAVCLAILKTRPERLCAFSSSLLTAAGSAGLVCGVPAIDLLPPLPGQMLLRRAPVRSLTNDLLHHPAIRRIRLPLEPTLPGCLAKRVASRLRSAVVATGRQLLSDRHTGRTVPLRAGADAALEWLCRLWLRPLFRIVPPPSGATDGGKVLFVIGSLGPGGAERQASLTLTGLAARNGTPPCTLVCQYLTSAGERFFLPELEKAGIPAYALASPDELSAQAAGPIALARRLPLSLREIAAFLQTIARFRPRTVHLWLDDINVKAGLAALILGVPRIVLSLRSLPPTHFRFWQPYMRPIYRHLAARREVVLTCNSTAGARAYEQWLGLAEGRIRVVRNGFDFAALDTQDIPALRQSYRRSLPTAFAEDAPIMGTVIRLGEEKRPLLWLRIAAEVHRRMPDARFLLVGDGPLRDEVRQTVRRLGLMDVLHMAGHERQPAAAMAAMDLFLLTSRVEGLPNVLIEAQALGVPVVTSPAGGAPETLEDGRTGRVLADASPAAAAEAIVSLLGDPAWRREAATLAPALVRQRFGMARMLDETLALYDVFPETDGTA